LEKLKERVKRLEEELAELGEKTENCLCGEELDERIERVTSLKAEELLKDSKFHQWLEDTVSQYIYDEIGDKLVDFIAEEVSQVIAEEIDEIVEQKVRDKVRKLLREELRELNLKQLPEEYLEERVWSSE
jgi:dephospho-CoA kinase